MGYKITEIPYAWDKERHFLLDETGDPHNKDRKALIDLKVYYDSIDQEFHGLIGLKLYGLGQDIQDPYDLIGHVITDFDKDSDSERVHVFKCDRCKKIKDHRSNMTTGHGRTDDGRIHCFACCGLEDAESMIETGKIALYLTFKTEEYHTWSGSEYVRSNRQIPSQITNWPGSLRFDLLSWSKGDHNWGIDRYDLWFKGPDDRVWYGRHQGHNTEIVHCKQTKHTGYAGIVADRFHLTIQE